MNSNNKVIEGFLYLIFLALVFGLVLYKIVFISNISFETSFFTIYGIITTLFLLSRLPYAYLYNDDHKKIYSDSEYPSVTIIIAAKNERGGIFKTLTTCMNSKYSGKLECIVIDDGSTDNTKSEVERAQHLYNKETEKIKLIIFPENRGKKEAMAVGISEALHDIIVFVDSDTFLSPDAIYHITRHFIDNKKIGAVSGNTKVENSNTNLLTKMQSIQYSISFNIYKASESMHNCVTCCPGCFSAYRKKAIKPLANRWKEQKFLGKRGTFGDDRSLTNFVLRKWDVVFCQKAIATTIVPEKFSMYWKQQLRWKKSWIREGIFAGMFMWKKKNPLASFAFYVNFSFPIVGPILIAFVLLHSIAYSNLLLFLLFLLGFILLGLVFALFVRVHLKEKDWIAIPIFSTLFVFLFVWQMPIALITLNDTKWGTR